MREPPLIRLPNGERVQAWPRRPWLLRALDWLAARLFTPHVAGGLLVVVAAVVIAERMTHSEGKQ